MMFGSFGTMVLFSLVVVVLGRLLVRTRGQQQPAQAGGRELLAAVRAARVRLFAAIGVTALTLVAGYVITLVAPGSVGLPLALAPSLAGAAGLTVYALTPPPRDTAENTARATASASLDARRAVDFVSRGSMIGLGALAAAALALLVATGITSSPDELGRYRFITLSNDSITSSSGPYTGWFYATPLLLTTLLLALATLFALRRTASAPALPGASLVAQDRLWRMATVRIITTLTAAVLSLQIGGTAIMSGLALQSAARSLIDSPASGQGAVAAAPIGLALAVLGAVALLASLAWFTLCVLRTVDLTRSVERSVRRLGGTATTATATVGETR